MNGKLSVKDMPEHGLSLVTSADPAFGSLMADLLKDKPSAWGEALKPFSVFFRNASHHVVVGYQLKWEYMWPNGRITTSTSGHATTWIFIYGVAAYKASPPHDRTALEPQAARFFSLAAPPDVLREQEDSLAFSFGFKDEINAKRFRQAEQKHDVLAQVEALNAELSQFRNITVSIDGAFFDDGTFVGPDSTGFFSQIKAEIDARYDLLREIKLGLEHGKSVDEILRPYEELVKESRGHPSHATTDHYNSYKQIFAREPLAVKMSVSDDEARRQALSDYVKKRSTGWVTLRKM